ncbi:siderophore iron transporter [Aspergillus pseudoustus]|uniref:Siderophore iron transporter n=1 Tax=Aspergillus pseudoustus TaxID=1810923 RepID=A0ABR4JVL9_9EURO
MDSPNAEIPKGYFYSFNFLGTMIAVGFSVLGSIGGFSLAAPIIGAINADIGPDRNISWVPLVFPVGLAVGQPLVGRLSDIFGRRWFMASTQIVAIIGGAISATAQNVPTLIGGSSLIGLAASGAMSYPFVIGEIVPMKYRFMGNGFANVWAIPFSGFGAVVANSLVATASWRWCYYIMIIFSGLSMVCYLFCYHPPTFEMKHSKRERLTLARKLDWIGIFLFISGIVLFLIGLSWGGNVYPWRSAYVICTVVIGALCIAAFFLWEVYHPSDEPLVPMFLFRDRGWVLSSILVSIPASVYYGIGVVWPAMVNTLYADGDPIYAGWLQTAMVGAYTFGLIIGPSVYKYTGHLRTHLVGSTTIGGALLAAAAASTINGEVLPTVLLAVGTFFLGCVEAQTFTLPGLYIQNQDDIGAAVGVAGSFRSVISTTASTIFVAILNNRLASTVPSAVTPAVLRAGLPESSVPDLLTALPPDTAATVEDVVGMTPAIQTIAVEAFKTGSLSAYRTVFYSTIFCTVFGILCSIFMPRVDHLMTNEVSVRLDNAREGPVAKGRNDEESCDSTA